MMNVSCCVTVLYQHPFSPLLSLPLITTTNFLQLQSQFMSLVCICYNLSFIDLITSSFYSATHFRDNNDESLIFSIIIVSLFFLLTQNAVIWPCSLLSRLIQLFSSATEGADSFIFSLKTSLDTLYKHYLFCIGTSTFSSLLTTKKYHHSIMHFLLFVCVNWEPQRWQLLKHSQVSQIPFSLHRKLQGSWQDASQR